MLISIVTVNFNDKDGLEKTMNSVFSQTYKAIEYIIIDGGSNDGSGELIKANSSNFSYWVSEPDTGIYNAMNKGIKKATGDYILFLNSGDYLYDDNVIASFVEEKPNADIVYGKIKWLEGEKTWDGNYANEITFKYFSNASLPHQGSFIKRELFEEIGGYDEDLKIVSDWKFFVLAIYKYHHSYRRIDHFISVCNRDGLSCKPESWLKILAERESTLKTYFPAFYQDLAIYNHKEEKLKKQILKLKEKQKKWPFKLLNKLYKL